MAQSAAAAQSSHHASASAPRLRYASFESRVAAGALDFLVLVIISALMAIVGSMIILISSDFERVSPSGTAIDLFWVCIFAIPVLFMVYLIAGYARRGQTAGCAVMQIQVLRSDGRTLGVLGSIARTVAMAAYAVMVGIGVLAAIIFDSNPAAAAAALAVPLLLIVAGILLAAFDSHRRTLHDRIAGTIVVRSR